jgi:hypothetical protein
MTVTLPLGMLRTLQEQYLPDVCNVSRGTETASGDGTAVTWAAIATGVPCRVSPLASGTGETLGADASLQSVAQWTVWVPAGTDATVKDRIVFGARTFEIARVGARSYETVRELICREVV